MIYNVPEGSEGVGKDGNCLKYVSYLLKEEIGLDPVPHVQAAHRSSRKTQAVEPRGSKSDNSQTKGKEEQNRPRHYSCPLYIHDVNPYTREVDRKLRQVMKDMRSKGWLAFIPWTVPRLGFYTLDSPQSDQIQKYTSWY